VGTEAIERRRGHRHENGRSVAAFFGRTRFRRIALTSGRFCHPQEFDSPLSIAARLIRLQGTSGHVGRSRGEPVMQYILLIYENEAEAKNRNPEESKRIFGEYMTFTASIKASGHMRAGEPLESTATATTVRSADRRRL
jgi:hypothetical protein